MKTEDIEMYNGVSMADMIREAHEITQDKRKKILNIIESISPMIKNIADASVLSPIISTFLEVSVKNDDQLIKLIQAVQRLSISISKNVDNSADILSDSEREELLKNLVNDVDIDSDLKLLESVGVK